MLAKVAAEKKVATQLGTQIHASDNFRRIVELVRGGAIGAVEECHIWVRGGRSPREPPDGDTTRPQRASLGSLPGDGALPPLSSHLFPRLRRQLAELVGFRHRWSRQHRHPLLQPGLLGSESPLSDLSGGRGTAAASRDGSRADPCPLPVSGPRTDAAGHPDLDARRSTATGRCRKLTSQTGPGGSLWAPRECCW